MNTVAEAQKKGKCDHDVITLVTIHNDTGATMTYFTKHDFSGKLVERTYPVKIENGQYDVFEHKGTSGNSTGSCGAVVYLFTNKDDKVCEWMLSWSSPTNEDNMVFTEIAEHGHYKTKSKDPIWIHVHEQLTNSGTSSTYKRNGSDSSVTSTPSGLCETRRRCGSNIETSHSQGLRSCDLRPSHT